MKCLRPGCHKQMEEDIDDILRNGCGRCPDGHLSHLPGYTNQDNLCVCGARATKQPGHSWFCPEDKKRPK